MLASFALTFVSLASLALGFPAVAVAGGQNLQARGGYEPVIHEVAVGKDGLNYTPPFVHAKKGDVVKFTYFPKDHTVTQSSFDSPCTKLESPFNSQLDIGIDSSFNFATNDTAGGPVFAFTVQTDPSVPLWFYCRQTIPTSHCKAGMVFAVNAPKTGNTFAKFLANAKAS